MEAVVGEAETMELLTPMATMNRALAAEAEDIVPYRRMFPLPKKSLILL